MKKYFILSVVLLTAVSFSLAQNNFSLPEGESVLVYSLPKTELCIEIEVEKTVQKPGEFYRYSERYLATKDVITEEKTIFRLKTVKLKTRPVADPNRTYSLVPDKNFPLNNISINEKGLLCGINVPCKEIPCCKKSVENGFAKKNITKPLPLTEEYMLAASTTKMAEGAAKQIYRIRESRLALLTADVDQLPADGESFKVMLKGMDKMERELTELFVGTTTVETQSHIIYLTPAAAMKNEVLFRISSLKGLVAASDLSGSPYYINVTPELIDTHLPAETNKKKATVVKPEIYSVLPAATQITIGDGKNTFFAEQFLMPQFGQIIPIPEELLKNKNAKIYIDEQTGRLLTISVP